MQLLHIDSSVLGSNSASRALSAEIVARAKTGFGVPTGAWMNAATGNAAVAVRGRPLEAKGLMSRRWSRTVLHGFA